MKLSVRKLLIFIVVILLIFGFGYIGLNVFNDNKSKDNDKNKVSEKAYEIKELINIKNDHCDNGYCISEYSITQMEDGKFELKFKFLNNNQEAVKDSCYKLYFSEEDSYITCYDLVEALGDVYSTYILDEDNFSKYSDYNFIKLTGDELDRYYKEFSKNLVVERK